MNVEQQMLAIIDSVRDRSPADAIRSAENDIGYGEYGLALENLCENLFEASVQLTTSEVEMIATSASNMKLDDARWMFIKGLHSQKDELTNHFSSCDEDE